MSLSSETYGSESRSQRPRVLLLAYLCGPNQGSEAGIGWNHAVEVAASFDVTVVTCRHAHGSEIDQFLDQQGAIPGLEFKFVEKTPLEVRLSRFPGFYWLTYNRWQRRVYRTIRRLHQANPFDLVHQLTLCGYREPGYGWKLGIPFVWGPVGGTQEFPLRFLSCAGVWGAIREVLRTVGNRCQLRFSRRIRRAAAAADLLMVANSTNQRDFERHLGMEVIRLLETAISDLPPPREEVDRQGPLKILWTGNLEPWKGLPLLLRSLAALPPDLPFTVRIVGRGSQRNRYQRMAEALRVDHRIEWMGWLPREQALAQYEWADVFVFSSLRDTSGNVVLEALAAGVPVICLDHQGAHDMVTPESGFKIPVTCPAEVVGEMTAALESLYADPETWRRLSQGARVRAMDFLWSERGELFAQLYTDALRQTSVESPLVALEVTG